MQSGTTVLIAVAYDVRDDKRRTKLAHALQSFGKRVQLSVFEGLLDEPQVERMRRAVERILAPEEDSVRIYRLCGACEPKVEVAGVGVRSEDPDVYMVGLRLFDQGQVRRIDDLTSVLP